MSKELNIDLGQSALTVTASVYLAGSLKASAIACAEIGVTGNYSGDFTATPNVAGTYQVAFFASGSALSCGGGEIVWDGTAEVQPNGAAAADALLDRADAIETGLTVRKLLRLLGSVMGGKLSGAGTGLEVFRNAVADSKDRVTATVDSSGNRNAITTDLT